MKQVIVFYFQLFPKFVSEEYPECAKEYNQESQKPNETLLECNVKEDIMAVDKVEKRDAQDVLGVEPWKISQTSTGEWNIGDQINSLMNYLNTIFSACWSR